MNNKISRRTFLGTSATAVAAFTVIPGHTMGNVLGHKAPSDKLNIAAVGIGARGRTPINGVRTTENIVALCDIDWKYANRVFEAIPDAKRYWDWRKMYDEMDKSIDAVIIATADHTHAIIAAQAITSGKHVYVEKPMTHSVYESRLLSHLAAKHKVATQMGNQGSSGAGVRLACDWVWNGEIGEVKRVDTFSDRPIWPQGLEAPKQGMWVPDTLNWDLFTGPAKLVPYHETYHPRNWRAWWDYGTGALGDMACHIMHPVFKALHLGFPNKVQGKSTLLLADCAPTAQIVRYTFPARNIPGIKKVKFPEVEVYWYDGGLQPMLPDGWPVGKVLNPGGAIFYGTKDTMVCDRDPWLLSGRIPNAPKTQREITESHEMDWIRACKESPENRIPTASDFSEAGPFNEMVVMGVLAVRLQGLNKVLDWDGANMQFTNIGENEEIAFTLSGDEKETHNARQFARELIKHTYREGWSLPAMP